MTSVPLNPSIVVTFETLCFDLVRDAGVRFGFTVAQGSLLRCAQCLSALFTRFSKGIF
jgi:hypothetical protein